MSSNGATSPAIGPGRTRLFRLAVLCAAALALFVLPFAHLPTHPVVSVSYVAGADNRLATIGLAMLSLLTLIVEWRWGLSLPSTTNLETDESTRNNAGIPRWLVWSGLAAVVVFTLGLGFLVQRSGFRYGEAGYFIERTRDLVEYHFRLYRDLEFTYGPLLLLPAAWLHHALAALHISVGACYFLSLATMNAVGLAMVAWLLNRLPLTCRWRILLFCVCLLVQLHPLAGANYSLFKFAAPPFLFLWSARRRGVLASTLAFIGTNLLVLLISPELGVGTAAGTIAYALLLLLRRQWSAVTLLFTPPAAVAIFILSFGRGFIDRLAHASAGALNLIPEPMPHLIILGIATAWLAPLLVGSRLRGRSPDAPVLAGLFVLALGILPGALGRCDPLHVFFNGLTMLFLSAIAVQGAWGRRWWAAALVVLALDVQAVNYRLYGPSLQALLRPPAVPTIDIAALRAATGGSRVATPDLGGWLPLSIESQLRNSGLFKPDFYPGVIEVWDEAGVHRKIDTLHQSEWMLAPVEFETLTEPLPNTPVKRLFRFGYSYPQRQAPLIVGAALNHDLRTNWTATGTFGGLTLYRRKPELQP
jgi:hypothetical protein